MPEQNETAADDVLVIPQDQRSNIQQLSRRHVVAKIAHECAAARYRNAVKSGNFEQALAEFDSGVTLEDDVNRAVNEFWAGITALFPDARMEDWEYDSRDVKLTRRTRSSMLDMLQGMVQ